MSKFYQLTYKSIVFLLCLTSFASATIDEKSYETALQELNDGNAEPCKNLIDSLKTLPEKEAFLSYQGKFNQTFLKAATQQQISEIIESIKVVKTEIDATINANNETTNAATKIQAFFRGYRSNKTNPKIKLHDKMQNLAAIIMNKDNKNFFKTINNYKKDDFSQLINGFTMLQMAVLRGSPEMVEKLCEFCDINSRFEQKQYYNKESGFFDGQTALHMAAMGGRTDIVDVLIKAPLQQYEDQLRSQEKKRPELGTFNQGLVLAKRLSLEYQILNSILSSLTKRSNSNLLHLAVANDHLELVQYLLSLKEYSFWDMQNNDGVTPLKIAVASSNAAIVQRLLKDLDATNQFWRTNFFNLVKIAKERSDEAILSLLLNKTNEAN